MAEPVGFASGLLALTVFAYKSSTKVYETIQNFKSHPQKVRELQTELNALNGVLKRLSEIAGIDVDVDLSALEVTLEQCRHSCEDFEGELLKYRSRSGDDRASFRDWAKFAYRGSDGIDAFRTQLSGYKATINVALSFANL